jgi:hypothetical protein
LPTGFAGTATIEVLPWTGLATTLAIGNGEGVLTAPLEEQPLNVMQSRASERNTFGGRRINSRLRKPAFLSYTACVNALMDVDGMTWSLSWFFRNDLYRVQRKPWTVTTAV